MILELDCGNSFIKWRVLDASASGLVSEGVVDSNQALLESLRIIKSLSLRTCRLVSVRTNEETSALTEMLERAFGIPIVCAKPAREMSGVRNGYEDYERLGLDRWLASHEEYQFIMDVNVKGLFNVLSTSLSPGFLEDSSSIVHVGSMFSLQGFKNGAVFAASKHAALGMVRSAAKETNGRTRVNCILPYVLLLPLLPVIIVLTLTLLSGVVDTPMHRANLARVQDFAPTPTTPIPRDGRAGEVANVVVFLLSGESGFVTGAAWSVNRCYQRTDRRKIEET